MAENIEIKVQDKVDSSISAKLKNIASDSRSADSAVKALWLSLNSISASSGISRLQSELAKTAVSQQRLATETQKTATAATQAQTAQISLASASQRLAAATANAAAASDRASVAALRLSQAQNKATTSADRMTKEAESLKRSLYPLYDAQQTHNASVQKALSLYKAGAIDVKTYTDAVNRSGDRLKAAQADQNAFGNGLARTTKGSQLARHHLLNLGFQVQDIGVSLASGQKPLTVFIQQGAQIAGIASQAGAGLGTMAKAAAAMLVPFLPLVAALGVAAGAFKLFQSEVNKGANLEAYAKSLGATSKQIKELDLNTVTFMDTMKGLWATVSEKTGADNFFDGIWQSAKKTFENILGYIALSVQSIIAIVQSIAPVIQEVFARLPSPVKKTMAEIANSVIGLFENMANASIKAINLIIEGLNTFSTVKIDPLEAVSFDKLPTEFAEASGKSLADIFAESYVTNLEKNKAATSSFIADWMKNTETAAKSRIKKSLEDANKEKTDKSSENRAAALLKVNTQLDNELARMDMLLPAREAQAKFDQIEEQLIGKKIKLTDTERTSIMAKIEAVKEATEVQRQFDAIYTQATKPLEEYNATQKATEKLLKAGAISQEQADAAIRKSSEAYENSLDPMRQYNKDLQQEFDLLKMLPKEREIEQKIMQVQNSLLAEGKKLNEEELIQLREKLELLRQLGTMSRARDQLQGEFQQPREEFTARQTAIGEMVKAGGQSAEDAKAAQLSDLSAMGINTDFFQSALNTQLNQYEQYQSKLEEMRAAGALKEEEYANASLQLELMKQNAQLNAMSGFFGQVAQLQNSENKKMATVGKAAAIAQAMINTYQSATGAYASLSSIPYVGPALGAAAAAAAIAAGMANVAQIRSQSTGFMTGGYTGNIPRDEVAGAVHGQEFVMNAASTNRVGVDNLQALQSGAASVQRNGENVGNDKQEAPTPQVSVAVPVTAVVVQSKESALAALKSSEGKAFVIEAIEENGSTVARIVGAK